MVEGLPILSRRQVFYKGTQLDELADTNIPGSMEVTVRVPDKILQLADEVVNIDLIAEELITRLKEGKIYDHSKSHKLLPFFSVRKTITVAGTCLKRSCMAGRTKSGP